MIQTMENKEIEDTEKTLDKQENNKPARDARGKLLPGNSGNLKGRPKGQSLKEYEREKFSKMTEEQKEIFLDTISPELRYRMAEGNPKQDTDITSAGEPIGVVQIPEKNKE